MKAGKHTYLIQDPRIDTYTMHTTICDFRTEDPPKMVKPYRKKVTHRMFNKNQSVFAAWKEDTSESLQAAAQMDLD